MTKSTLARERTAGLLLYPAKPNFDPDSGLSLGPRGLQWSAFANASAGGLLTKLHDRWGFARAEANRLGQREAFNSNGTGAWLEINPARTPPERLALLMQDPEYDAGRALQRGEERGDGHFEYTYGEESDVAGLSWHTLTSDYDEDVAPGDPVDTIEEGQHLTLVAYPPAMVGPDPVGMLMFNVSVPPRERMVTEFNVELQEIFVCPSKRGEPGYAHALALGCVYVLSELLAVANAKAARGSSVCMWLSHEPHSETADRIASRIHTELEHACARLQAQRRRDSVVFGVDLEFI